MTDFEPFTLVDETSRPGPHHLFDNVVELTSAKTADHDLQYIVALREASPGMIVTAIPAFNVPLRTFAAAGFATCELDTDTDSFASWRGYIPPALRQNRGHLGESVHFAKFRYRWNNEDFMLYTVSEMQYVLKERRDHEHALGPSHATDALIQTVGDWLGSDQEVVWVYDRYWARNKQLWREVQKASWDKVILDERQKKDLTGVANKFFSSRDVYEDLGVPWKRGLLFHGPPGCGKTSSIKALMHTLLDREDTIPTLYVKSAPLTYDIRNVFAQARALSPCMLVLEDIETIVTPQTRSYFFNEYVSLHLYRLTILTDNVARMDGLENNDGLFIVASTNFLDKLDPGLSKRPSRFDRKYLFPLPNEHERTLYCEYWRRKVQSRPSIDFPKLLCPVMAHITAGFSFAFLQECFVATLLILARGETGECGDEDTYVDGEKPEDYELWRVFKQQADTLRKEIESQESTASCQTTERCGDGDDAACSPPQPASRSGAATTSSPLHRPDTVLPDLRALHVRHDAPLLSPLPGQFAKRPFLNSAALDYRYR